MTRARHTVVSVASFRRERGVVLFIALIAMVVLSLAGIGLMRSVDTGVGVFGNLAFRQASVAPVNHAIETAVDAIYKSKLIANLYADDPANRYYATLQAGEHPNGLPAILTGAYPPALYDGAFAHDTDPTTRPRGALGDRARLHCARCTDHRQLRPDAAEGFQGGDRQQVRSAAASADSTLSRHDPGRLAQHQCRDVRADIAALIREKAQGELP